MDRVPPAARAVHLGAARMGAVLLAAAVLSACATGSAGGGAQASASGAGPSGAGASSTPPASGSVTAAPLPAGWTRGEAEGLSFGVPPGLTLTTSGGIPEAQVTYRGAATPGGPTPPALAAFVEHGNVGPLEVRTQLVTKVRTAQLGAPPDGPARTVTVPGSVGATVTEWHWDYSVTAGADPVPSRQLEVVVQTSGSVQYGLLLGGPTPQLPDALVQTFLASLQVSPAAAG